MPPQIALLVATIFVAYAYRTDSKRNPGDKSGLFWPSLWYLVVASRPAGVWLAIWGVPLPTGGDATDGSIIDRAFYGVLTLIGLKILAGKNFQWGPTLRQNPWLTTLLVFMAASIVWSQYPLISFKRYVKVIGALVMAFVVLANDNPLQAFCTVLRRCLYVHLPMSILCTRYYRSIGVSFDWNGTTEAWQGISTSKNTLGQIAMLGAVYFTWELWRNRRRLGWKNLYLVYLLMALYLLKGAGAISMTSVSVTVFAMLVFFRIQSLRGRVAAVRGFVMRVFFATSTLILFVVTHSVVMFSENSIFGKVITTLGRDITLTDRTYIWHDVYAACTNPILGIGFGGFWIGRTANIPWNAEMTWILGQAHSGYIDTYLQLGFVGVGLLALSLISSLWKAMGTLDWDFDFAAFRITLMLTIIYINMTESIYLRGDHHMWFLLMAITWSVAPVPRARGSAPPAPSAVDARMEAS